MRKVLIISLFLASVEAYTQQPHCHTDEYVKIQIENDPSFKTGLDKAKTEVLNYSLLNTRESGDDEIYVIPVVFHIVYSIEAENISDEQIFEQIDILNEDFRRLNDDADETPDAFAGDAADAKIEFQLAMYDEDGNPTTGITRTETDILSWNLFTSTTADNFADKVKDSDDGGIDGWDRDCYLNIWVCDLGAAILGYATPPGGVSSKDGVVIGYKYIGNDGTGSGPYNKGRTATHEIGHWLGLWHIWGDDEGACGGSDLIADTPNQTDETYGCPSFPKTDACSPDSPGVMFMNYMDYSDDACLNMFTQGQVNKMRDVLETSREEILECTKAFVDIPGAIDKNTEYIDIFPNPSAGIFTVNIFNKEAHKVILEIYNTNGQIILSTAENGSSDHTLELDMRAFANGIYLVRVFDGMNYFTEQLFIEK